MYGEWALQQAAEADARVAKGDFPPLIGIPIAVNDEIDIAGELTSHGTGAYTTPAPADAEVVRRLRAAGAIVIGKTKMPELGLWPFTESITRVPMTPHYANGVQWVVFGAVTRSVLDTGVMLDVLSTQSPGFAQATRTQPGSLRVGVVRGFPVGAPGRLGDEVSGTLDRAADLLGSLGHTVTEQKIDMRTQDTAVILGLMFRFIRELALNVERPPRLERRTRAFARAGALISDRTKERLLRGQDRLAERLGRLFDDHDVLLTPMMSEPAVAAGIMEGRGTTTSGLISGRV